MIRRSAVAKYYAWTTITTRTIVIKATTANSFLVRMQLHQSWRVQKILLRKAVPKLSCRWSLTCCQNFATPKSSMSTTSWAKARSHLQKLVQNKDKVETVMKRSWKAILFFQDCLHLHQRLQLLQKSPKSCSSWRVARWPAWKICSLLTNSTPMPSNYNWLHCHSRPIPK